MVQRTDNDDHRRGDRDEGHPPSAPGSVQPVPVIANPVQSTLQTTGEHCRFSGSADAPPGTRRMTIALHGATSYHLTIPHRPQPHATIAWDVGLVIQPGISEATVTTEDHAGNRTTVRRMLIARAFTTAATGPGMETTRIGGRPTTV